MPVPAEQLRAWAEGTYPTEAAVEMLIRAHAGRFADTSCPWIEPTQNPARMYRVDWDKLHDHAGIYSGGEQRFLNVVTSLGSPHHPVDLANSLSGLDGELLELVLAATAHAAGSHDRPVRTRPTINSPDGTPSLSTKAGDRTAGHLSSGVFAHWLTTWLSVTRPRRTFSRIESTVAVQTNGLGSSLWASR
jgi:hypothetical protein